MFKDNFNNTSSTAALTPTRLLLNSNNMDSNTTSTEWGLNGPAINDFSNYMNEINPFDETSALFNQKFENTQPSHTTDNFMMPSKSMKASFENKVDTYAQAPPTPPSHASDEVPPRKQRKKLLEKNREAAYRCRQKKKKWVNELEEKSELVEHRNKELLEQVSQLREESIYLRNLLLTHGNCECEVVQAYLRRTSEQLTKNANNTGALPALIGSTSSVSGSESSLSTTTRQFYDNTADMNKKARKENMLVTGQQSFVFQ